MSADDAKSNQESGLSDEEWRKLLKPSISKAQANYVISKSYAGAGESVEVLEQLDSYDDVNFRVKLSGKTYLLKIHNGVESRDFNKVFEAAGRDYSRKGCMNSVVHLQSTMMTLLSSHGINTCEPKMALDTNSPICVHTLPVVSTKHSPQQLVVRLLTWVEGRLMSSVDILPIETLADAGRYLGWIDKVLDEISESAIQPTEKGPPDCPAKKERLSAWVNFNRRPSMRSQVVNKAKDFSLDSSTNSLLAAVQQVQIEERTGTLSVEEPEIDLDSSLLEPARRFHQWDGKNTAELRGFTSCITDDRRRSMVLSIIDTFQAEILDSGDAKRFREGVNHGDYNDANILIDESFHVSGVIDFGDSVESWRVLDCSVAMAYAMLSSYGKVNRGMSAAAAVLRGYNMIYPLTPLERKHLVLLVACRLACSVTLGAYSYSQNPENKYLLFHAEPAWATLEMFWCRDPDRRAAMQRAFARVLDQACLYNGSREYVISCSDLVFPDPTVVDFLAEVRMSNSFKLPLDTTHDVSPPEKKRRKTLPNGPPIVTFVTGNQKKLEELQRILFSDESGNSSETKLQFHLTNQNIDLPELQGDPIAIAKEKCILAANKVDGAVIVEDTSLCFNSLGGMPGPYIKWFLDSCGLDGLKKLLDAYDDKTAYSMTVVAFCAGPGKEPAVFCGRTTGTIVAPRGRLEFGWDPIFQPSEASGGKTFAEMSQEEKDAISHRRRAFAQLHAYLSKGHVSL